MNLKLKLTVSMICAVIALNISSIAFAAFSDVPSTESYAAEVNRLQSLGIINGNEKGEFKPNDPITREQFARLIIAVADEEERANVYKNMTMFPDVKSSRWSAGFVNAAVKLEYMKGMLDGKFHPDEGVTYAQVCTVLVKMLGYTDADLSGTWPQNYLLKAKEVGISENVAFSANDTLPRWAVAVMLDNLLDSNLKSNPSKKFYETIERYTQYIILETSKTSSSVAEGEILTDKGTFYLGNSSIELEVGYKYALDIKKDTIYGVYGKMADTLKLSIDGVNGTTITYKDSRGTGSMVLPSAPAYYYKGIQQKYSDVPKLLEKCSSIVLSRNNSGTGYEYGVIFDPVYSKPEIAGKSSVTNNGVGKIVMDSSVEITRNGSIISKSEIEKDDVLYTVSDIWGGNKYILDVNDSVKGELTAILPNKVSPKSVSIDNVSYELGEDMDLSKINSQGVLKVEDSVTVLLGYDGKVVDIYSSVVEDNSEFAMVLSNYKKKSTSIEDYGKEYIYVKLLHTDNTTKTYRLQTEGNDTIDLGYAAKLVKFKKVGEEADNEPAVVKLEALNYLNAKEYVIDTNKKKIDDYYFADNIKIFNIITKVQGADSNIYLMNPSDLPNGAVIPGKIKYLNRVGPFEYVNVMVVENILEENKYLGIVTGKKGSYSPIGGVVEYTSTILIEDREYTTNYDVTGLTVGAVVQVELRNDKITSLYSVQQPAVKAVKIEAIDSGRVKIDGKIYDLKNNVSIYFADYDGEYERKGTDDIDVTHKYDKITVFLDKPLKYGGEVETIIIED